MKKIIIYLILLFSYQSTHSQIEPEWIASYNGIGNQVVADDNGYIYVAGNSQVGGGIITLKYNSSGVLQWSRFYGGGVIYSTAKTLSLDSEGNVYVGGHTTGGNSDYLIIKYDAFGNEMWTRTYSGSGNGSDIIRGATVDKFGNVFVTGNTNEGSERGEDITTIKYDNAGSLVWIRKFNGTAQQGINGDIGNAIIVDSIGNAYITGETTIGTLVSYKPQAITIKYDISGNVVWEKTYEGYGGAGGGSIKVDNDGNVYIGGAASSLGSLSDILTIKYNSAGNPQWVKLYNGPGNYRDGFGGLAIDNLGNVYVTGSSRGIGTGDDYTTIKYSSDGLEQWVRRYNGASNLMDVSFSIGVDALGNVFVTGSSFESGYGNSDYTTIKYDPDGNTQWIHSYNGQGNYLDGAYSLTVDPLGNVYVTGYSFVNSTTANITTIKYPGKRYPVFIVPGIAGTYSSSTSADLPWILTRGVTPAELQIDPLGKVYNDIIETFVNVGYKKDTTLFVVNYDWRLTPGPIDNDIDGKIDGLSGVSITDNQFNYGVDYLGWYIKKACEIWREKYDEDLDSIDVIAHSTGGLVSRTYLQSDAYGDLYDLANNYKLPRIRNLIMIGVPNRGASKAWNALNDNWSADIVYRFVLSKILNRAYQKVLQDNAIQGPDTVITRISIQDPSGNPSKTKFISLYVPTIRGLLATYNFIDLGSGYVNVNNDLDKRNTFLLDLNDGLDLNSSADANKFLDSARVFVIHGTGEKTKDLVQQRSDFGLLALQSFTDWTPSNASSGTIWYKDLEAEQNGDKTVPTISSAGQFQNDNRATLIPFNTGDHTALVSKIEVQSNILDILNVAYESNDISTGSSASFSNVWNVISDPVDLILLDGNGNRLGYTTSTGALTEIPNSIWFGNTDGMGYIFGSVTEPVNLQLTGLGEDYYVMVSVEDSGRYGGVVLEGFLAQGEVINYQIKLDPLSIEQLTLNADDFTLAQNYPNPFNPVTTIQYSIPQRSSVTLKVYDVLGNEIAALVNEEKDRGVYSVTFDASQLASGIYFYRIQAGSFVETKKMILLR